MSKIVSKGEISRRALLRDVAYLGGGALILSACTSEGSSDPAGSEGSPDPTGTSGAGLPDVEGGRVITDPSQFPTSFQEAPEFARQVAAGKLPPVAERIGQDPLVLEPVHEVGTYGGTLRRGFLGVEDSPNATQFCAGPDSLLYWDYTQENVVPNIARDFEMNSSGTELTLHLRRAMRWSDGHPFTADDVIFWRQDINLNPEISRGSAVLRVQNQDVVLEKLDDHTVLYRSPVPYGTLPEFLASSGDSDGPSRGARGGGGYAPKHYLSQFLPKYSSESEANAKAKDAGFESWAAYLLNQMSWDFNPDLPMLTPWIVTRPINDPPWEFAANPYSIWVDTEGNQLPYIGSITMSDTTDSQVLALRAVSGEYDFQDRGLQLVSLPVLVENESRSDYTIHQAPGEGMDAAVFMNLAYENDPEIGELLRSVEFRRALSLAVDRHQINETFFLGTSVPSATMASDNSPYFPGGEWRTMWATHDVEQANQLLDQIGLTDRDEDGFRTLPSGGGRLRLDIQSAISRVNFPAIGEQIRRQWESIGISAVNQEVQGTLYGERMRANEVMVSVNSVPGAEDPFIVGHGVTPGTRGNISLLFGQPYFEWFASGGTAGTKPPTPLEPMIEAVELYQEGLQAADEERVELGKRIFELHADNVFTIGLVGFGLSANGLYYAKNNLKNVPGRIVNSLRARSISITQPMAFYYDA